MQALLSDTTHDVWQMGKQQLVTALGERATQQAYQVVWLKTLLMQPDLSQACLYYFDYQQPYRIWMAVLGEHQIPAIHNLINQFLDQYDHSYPLGLEVVKAILSPEWVSRHEANDLINKLTAIEKVCQRQAQLKELTEMIQQQLTKGEYTTLANQFHFLLKQAAYCKEKDIERYPQSQETYQIALLILTQWIRQAVFTAPHVFAWVESIILPVLPEEEAETTIIHLCRSAENSRFAYDRLFLALYQVSS